MRDRQQPGVQRAREREREKKIQCVQLANNLTHSHVCVCVYLDTHLSDALHAISGSSERAPATRLLSSSSLGLSTLEKLKIVGAFAINAVKRVLEKNTKVDN
jgi:hypothetical protein